MPIPRAKVVFPGWFAFEWVAHGWPLERPITMKGGTFKGFIQIEDVAKYTYLLTVSTSLCPACHLARKGFV
jgi:hypothetical protein